MKMLKPNAETHRIRALGHLLRRDLATARLEINKAISKEPNRCITQETYAKIGYYSVLASVSLPDRLVLWPEPVDWPFIKRDDDSLATLRNAADCFRKLAENTEDERERILWQVWYLACLANDPNRQEEAIEHCISLLEKHPVDYRVLEWAIVRNYVVDIEPSEKALRKIVDGENPDMPYVIANVNCLLALGKKVDAIELLNEVEPKFDLMEDKRTLRIVYAQAQIANGDPHTALITIEETGSITEYEFAKMLALRAIAQQSGDWNPLIEFLEITYEKTHDVSFLFELCNLMNQQGNWRYTAEKYQLLIDGIGTPEALRLSAIACHNNRQFDVCLELLDNHREIFEGGLLPNELRRLRVSCQSELGAIPDAIRDAETLQTENPCADNLLTVLDLCFEKGDIKRLCIIAQQFEDMPDLTQKHLLRITNLVEFEDRDLAISFLERAISNEVPDDLVGTVIVLGYRLGLDQALKPFRSKAEELALRGEGGFGSIRFDEFVSHFKNKNNKLEELAENYKLGLMPIHLVADQLNLSILHLFHTNLERCEKEPDSKTLPFLLARHGGRHTIQSHLNGQPQWRLNIDVTAIILAAHLDILPQLENTFAPLRVPTHLVPCLLEIRSKLTSHQPSQLTIARQISDLGSQGILRTCKLEGISPESNAALEDEMGEHWVSVFKKAKSENGLVVCFLPLLVSDMSKSPTSLSIDDYRYIINCRSLVEALFREGPLSKADYEVVLENLGSENYENPNGAIPIQQRSVFLQDGIAEVLAEAEILNLVCERYSVFLGEWELDKFTNLLEYQRIVSDSVSWLDRLVKRLSDGIGTGVYTLIPPQDISDFKLLYQRQFSELSGKCLMELLGFKTQENDVIWSDDRYVNGYQNRDGAPIFGICEILKGLLASGAVSHQEYFKKFNQLRAGHVRFIPIEKEELLYYLSQARVDQGSLVETQQLSVLRRYIASCLLEQNTLQFPPMHEEASNEDGETAFILNLERTIPETIINLWSVGKDDIERRVKSSWLIDNLYLEYHGVIRALNETKDNQDDRYLVAISLSRLIALAITLNPEHEVEEDTPRQKYFEWLYENVLYSKFEADSILIVAVADHLKGHLESFLDLSNLSTPLPNIVTLLQLFYDDLPAILRNELNHDTDFMAKIHLRKL